MCDTCLLREFTRRLRKMESRILSAFNEMETRIMSAVEDLNAKIAGLEQNVADTAAGVSSVATSIGELKAEIQALKDQLAANAANGLSAEQTAEAIAKLDALVQSTQVNEDALNGLVSG